jgi:hypothetical protein
VEGTTTEFVPEPFERNFPMLRKLVTISALILGAHAAQAAPEVTTTRIGSETVATYYSCQKGTWDGYKWCYRQSYATYCYEDAMTWMDNQRQAGQKARVVASN